MKKLPKYILVLSLNSKGNYKIILNILKEFFEGFPCLLFTGDDNKDYYVLPNTVFINKILNNIDVKLDYPDSFRYDKYVYDTLNPRIWDTYILSSNYWRCDDDILPDEVTFWEISDVESLKLFSED